MTSAASRRMRGARNAIADALGLGETFPLRDLPVSAEPPVVPFGGGARVAIEDSEPGTVYRLRGQAGAPLPGAAAEAIGDGGTLGIATPRIEEDVGFTVEAVKPTGRTALLLAGGTVKVGLDAGLPAALAGLGTPPVVDFGASVTVALERSQEGVAYRLVARPAGDTAAPDDLAALGADVPLSAGDTMGSGGAIALPSTPLADDLVIRVRVMKTFDGRSRREAQTTLLTQALPVHVRADRARPLAVDPPIVAHAGAPALGIAGAQPGVRYAVHLAPIADTQFDRAEPPAAAAIGVPGDDGEVRVTPPPLGAVWAAVPGFAAAGEPVAGAGGDLALPLPALHRDTLVLVEARKTHGVAETAFESAVPLAPVAPLVRPDPAPGLRLEATIADGRLTRLRALAGQPGVFYVLSAGDQPLGELYLHQRDPADPAIDKGLNRLAIGVDLVVAAETAAEGSPAPRLDLEPRELPLALAITARRAQTRLTAPLASAPVIAESPDVIVEPAEIEVGGSATVTLAVATPGALHALLIDGTPLGEPSLGDGAALALATGSLAAGARVELWLADPPGIGIAVERRIALTLKVG